MTIHRIQVPVNRYVDRANHAREQKKLSSHVLNIKKITDPIINSASSIEASRGTNLAATVMEQTRKEIFSGPLDPLIDQIKPFLNPTIANSAAWETMLTINSMLKDLSAPTEKEFTSFSEEAGLLFNSNLKDVAKLEKKARDVLSNFLVKLSNADAKNDDKALAKALRKFGETTNTEALNRIGDRLLARVKLLPEKEFRVETLFGEAIVHLEHTYGGRIEETDKITQEFQERLNRFSRDDAVSETKYRQEILSMVDAFESLMGINRSKVGNDVQQALRKGAQNPNDNSSASSANNSTNNNNLENPNAGGAANDSGVLAPVSNPVPKPLQPDSSVVLMPKPTPVQLLAPAPESLPPMSSSDSSSVLPPFSSATDQTPAANLNGADDLDGAKNDKSSISIDDENVAPEALSAFTEEPSAVTEEPSAVTEEPSASAEEPSASNKKPSASVEEPQTPANSAQPTSKRLYPTGDRLYTTGNLATTVVQPGQGRRSSISSFAGIEPKLQKTKGDIPVQSYLELLKSRDGKLDMAARSHKTPSDGNANKAKVATPASSTFTPSARKKKTDKKVAASPSPENNMGRTNAATSVVKPEIVVTAPAKESSISFRPRTRAAATDQHPPVVFVPKMEGYVSDPKPADALTTNNPPEIELSSSSHKPAYVTRFIRGVESVRDENGKWTDVKKTVKDQLKAPVKVEDEKLLAPQEQIGFQGGETLAKRPSPVWDRRASVTPDVKGYRTVGLSNVIAQPRGRSESKSLMMGTSILTETPKNNLESGAASSDRAQLLASDSSPASRLSSPTEQDVIRLPSAENSASASRSGFRVKAWDTVAPPHLIRSPKLLTKEVKIEKDRSSPAIPKKA